ncbi:hypothetical protein TM239_01320 [Bradyrhizobium sp. TM239]|nr:hypothetical protein TM239_01320 [Bradyrhizobium sp. TM239]
MGGFFASACFARYRLTAAIAAMEATMMDADAIREPLGAAERGRRA